nr:reverse transcriptase domain-containing protein [Tanacetum cinerariifolium]
MDDEPMWVADHVVASTLGSVITIPETANEFAIKGNHLTLVKRNQFDGRTKQILTNTSMNFSESAICLNTEIPRMKFEITQKVLNATAGGIFLYKTPNQPYQLLEDKVLLKLGWVKNQKTRSSLKKTVAFADEGSSNSDTSKITARMDAMTLKPNAQYKELQPNTKIQNSILMMMTYLCHEKKLNSCKLSLFVLNKNNSTLELELFNINSAMKHSYSNDDTCFSIDVLDEILEEDFDALLNEGSKILHSIEGTLLEEEIFAEYIEFMAMTADENFVSESDTEEQPFKKITINTNYKIKTSLEEPHMDLELKPLLDNLEYVFLEEPCFLPVIKSSQLSKEKKN